MKLNIDSSSLLDLTSIEMLQLCIIEKVVIYNELVEKYGRGKIIDKFTSNEIADETISNLIESITGVKPSANNGGFEVCSDKPHNTVHSIIWEYVNSELYPTKNEIKEYLKTRYNISNLKSELLILKLLNKNIIKHESC